MKGVMCAVGVLFAGSAWAFPDEKPEVKALDMKGVTLTEQKGAGTPQKPIEVKSADELAKAAVFAEDVSRDAIKKQVDFAKSKLVVFAWSGSGGDRIAASLDKDGKVASFAYTAGRTDDLRHHRLVFAVPKDANVEVK